MPPRAIPSHSPPRPRRRGRIALLGLLVLATAGFQWGRYGGGLRVPFREGLPQVNDVVDRGFSFCRLMYQSVTREELGQGWRTDYPLSDLNFMTRFEELTTVQISRWDDGEPGIAVVRPLDADLYQCPFLFASDVGTVGFRTDEAAALRDYLLKGGFLWVDDFWGTRAWNRWSDEIARILPEYPIVDLPLDHPLLHALYVVSEVPQVPSIQFWNRSGRRSTSERGADSAEPHLRVIFDEADRPLVIMTHNTDIADGWEREGQDEEFFYTFSPESYALGMNVILWAMTH